MRPLRAAAYRAGKPSPEAVERIAVVAAWRPLLKDEHGGPRRECPARRGQDRGGLAGTATGDLSSALLARRGAWPLQPQGQGWSETGSYDDKTSERSSHCIELDGGLH